MYLNAYFIFKQILGSKLSIVITTVCSWGHVSMAVVLWRLAWNQLIFWNNVRDMFSNASCVQVLNEDCALSVSFERITFSFGLSLLWRCSTFACVALLHSQSEWPCVLCVKGEVHFASSFKNIFWTS